MYSKLLSNYHLIIQWQVCTCAGYNASYICEIVLARGSWASPASSADALFHHHNFIGPHCYDDNNHRRGWNGTNFIAELNLLVWTVFGRMLLKLLELMYYLSMECSWKTRTNFAAESSYKNRLFGFSSIGLHVFFSKYCYTKWT